MPQSCDIEEPAKRAKFDKPKHPHPKVPHDQLRKIAHAGDAIDKLQEPDGRDYSGMTVPAEGEFIVQYMFCFETHKMRWISFCKCMIFGLDDDLVLLG